MSDRAPSIEMFRPVLNIEQQQIDDLQQLAIDLEYKKIHLADSLFSFSLLGSGEVHDFYQQADHEPEEGDIQKLLEFCDECRPETANQKIDVPTWPADVKERDARKSPTKRRIRELLYLGASASVPSIEREDYKSIVAMFGDDYGPIVSRWPTHKTAGVQLGHAQRKHQDKSELRRYAKRLRNARILPEMLELGGVVVQSDTTEDDEIK